jgi:hypothetical protein
MAGASRWKGFESVGGLGRASLCSINKDKQVFKLLTLWCQEEFPLRDQIIDPGSPNELFSASFREDSRDFRVRGMRVSAND